jgi:PAS domain S-box-containing protein
MKSMILLVEDNPTTRKLVRFALEQKGYEVTEASTGKLAIEAVERRAPALVLQDLILPDIDGFELVSMLRQRLDAPRVPILAFSGFVSKLESARIAAVGFDDVVVKPIEPSRLVQIVQTYLPTDPSPLSGSFGAGRSLLLADDDPLQLKLAAFRFERLGFSVKTAPDGLSALEQARVEPPVAIVSDIMMPRMDGFRLCAEAKRDAALRTLPVILMTSSYVEEADRKLALESGAAACVLRTPDLHGVIAALRDALERPKTATTLKIDTETLERGHSQRIIQQLERQVAMNSSASQRCALLATELSIISGISTALSRDADIDASLDEILATFFDAAAVSTGALVLFEERARIRTFGNALRWSPEELASFFGDIQELQGLLRRGQPIRLPLPEGGLSAAYQAMQRAGVPSPLIVPLLLREEAQGFLLLSHNEDSGDVDERTSFAVSVVSQISNGIALARAFNAQKAAEKEARQKAAMLEAIMQSIPDGIAVTDEDGQFRLWNTGANEIIGLGSAKIEPVEWSSHYGFYLPDRTTPYPMAEFPLMRAMKGEAVENTEVFVRHAKAQQGMWLSVNARPLVQDGVPRGGVTVFRDVTAEKATQEQLMVSDRMASIGTIAAGVAHEINNPLAAVLANIEFTLQNTKDLEAEIGAMPQLEELQGSLQDALEATERVRQIAKDLKIFSRAEEDRREAVDTKRVLDSTLRIARGEVNHRARIVKEYSDVPLVEANESRLGQVFLNLIINAAQSIPEGQADKNNIVIRTGTDERGMVVVEIRDTGSGMTPETLKKIFTPFFTTKPSGIGTGLGLAICQRIITRIGGEIKVESKLGAGTTFTVFLPVVMTTEPTPTTRQPLPNHKRRRRLLIVDDDPNFGAALRRFLTTEYEVQLFTHAEEALELITRGERFDAILCDLMMPIVTGMEFYERLSAQVPEQAERIVFLTGGVFTNDARDFLHNNPNARLEKPFEIHELRALLNKLTELSRKSRED